MITDKLENAFLYENLGIRILKAFRFLKETDLEKLSDGRHDIDGSQIYASVSSYDTKPLNEGRFEAHKDYIDIQYLINGSERIYYAPLDQVKETEAYHKDKDIAFYEGKGDWVTVVPGIFLVLFPTDAHMPCIAIDKPSSVRKIVIKIRL